MAQIVPTGDIAAQSISRAPSATIEGMGEPLFWKHEYAFYVSLPGAIVLALVIGGLGFAVGYLWARRRP